MLLGNILDLEDKLQDAEVSLVRRKEDRKLVDEKYNNDVDRFQQLMDRYRKRTDDDSY